MKVKITPVSNRAKNRVCEHGDVMDCIHVNLDGSILCKALTPTWSNGGTLEKWLGWFERDEIAWESFRALN